MHWAIEVVETARSWDEAYEMLLGLAEQNGWIGGRVLPPGSGKTWRTQGFVVDEPHAGDMWLPDGCRRVLVSDGLWRQIAGGAHDEQ